MGVSTNKHMATTTTTPLKLVTRWNEPRKDVLESRKPTVETVKDEEKIGKPH